MMSVVEKKKKKYRYGLYKKNKRLHCVNRMGNWKAIDEKMVKNGFSDSMFFMILLTFSFIGHLQIIPCFFP